MTLPNTLTLAVSPGVPVCLLRSAPSGAVIINNDQTNAVWISDQPAVVPGTGILLAVGGTITWASAGSAVYACVDTGVTTPVSVTIGSNISQYDNPFGVGLAVAQQLLLKGVPNVLTNVIITSTDTVVGNTGINYPNVSGYASLLIKVRVTGTTVPNYGIRIRMGDSNSGALNAPTLDEIICLSPGTIAGNWTAAIMVPVTGPFMVINNLNTVDGAACVCNLTIIGSNRTLLAPRPYYNNRQEGIGHNVDQAFNPLPVGNSPFGGIGTQTVSGPVRLTVKVDDLQSAFVIGIQLADGNGGVISDYFGSTADLTPTINGSRVGKFDVIGPLSAYTYNLIVDIASAGATVVHLHAKAII